MDQTTGDMRPPDPYFERIPSTDVPPAYADRVDRTAEDDRVTYAELATRDATGGTEGESSDDIREDIEQTRSNMGDTIDAIQERLSPQNLAQQAKDTVREATIGKVEHTMNDMTETAKESGYTLLDTVRQNPIPAALTGIGVGWLIVKARENSERRSSYRTEGYATRYGRYQGPGPVYYGGYVGEPSQRGQTSSQSLGSQAHDAMSQVADQAQDVGGQLQDQAQQVASQAQYQAQRTVGWFERTMDESPLAMGLVAVAAGALVGMVVPESDQERQWMGPARDQLIEKAQDITQETADKAQQVARQATNAAKDEAKNQRLVQ